MYLEFLFLCTCRYHNVKTLGIRSSPCCSLVVTAAVSCLVAAVDQSSKAHILSVWSQLSGQRFKYLVPRGSRWLSKCFNSQAICCVSLHSGLWETSQSARDEQAESLNLLDRLSKPSTGISLCRYSFQCVARLLLIFILEAVGGGECACCRSELTMLVCEPLSIWSQSLDSLTFQHTSIHCERTLQQSSIKSAV